MYYKIGPHTFAGLPRVKDHARKLLARAIPEQKLEGRELEFIMGLLDRHPGVARKTGCGIESIFVRVNWKTEQYENRCFWIKRTDGTETDFSYLECITPTDHRSKFLTACRVAILPQIKAFRETELARLGTTALCPVTGREFVVANGHVDHQYPDTFESLVDQFIEEQLIDISVVEITSGQDGQLRDRFASSSLAQCWCEFHRVHAVLRLLPGSVNQRLGNRVS
jgi:hypothetical protein